jgi:protocatechuate 3,4-dioxygenase beta subunit
MEKKNEYQLTLGKEEGPYYTAGSPENSHFRSPQIPGRKLTLTGTVRDRKGNPLAGAWLDFWQADGEGHYDNQGFTLRGHQFTDINGHYSLETVIPGKYPNRTPHIHVKARASESSAILTTQLFIPGIAGNQGDYLFDQALLIKIEETPQGKVGTFDFVL